MNKNDLTVTRLAILKLLVVGFVGLSSSILCAQNGANTLNLRNGLNAYDGAEDFYTYLFENGTFNSKTDLDDQTLKISPIASDTKSVMRFKGIPLSRSSSGMIYRLTLVLTFKKPGQADTLMLHNLNATDIWDERTGNYNSLNGTAPWSGADGKLIDAWYTTDGIASITGGEKVNSKLVIEIHPNDATARKAVLNSWLDGGNQGFAICGISSDNEFYSSDAYNLADRPELIIEYSSY